jgi:hypothetical protein
VVFASTAAVAAVSPPVAILMEIAAVALLLMEVLTRRRRKFLRLGRSGGVAARRAFGRRWRWCLRFRRWRRFAVRCRCGLGRLGALLPFTLPTVGLGVFVGVGLALCLRIAAVRSAAATKRASTFGHAGRIMV